VAAPRPTTVFRWVALILLVLAGFLQLKLWTGPWSLSEVHRLEERVKAQREENEDLKKRNATLAADVEDLKSGKDAVEERARSELGMTKPGEVFYQVIEQPPAGGAADKAKEKH
jgi:cell division protein FtsB